nr:hypothetical protein [Wolbachia endosymbiont of Litomosoides sigmodontis]
MSFRRKKFVELGSPDSGNGEKSGNTIFVNNANLTLCLIFAIGKILKQVMEKVVRVEIDLA